MKRLTLGDVCQKASSNIAQKDLLERTGAYPIFGASGFIKQVDFYHQDKEYIAVVKDGAGIGRTMLLPAYSSVIGTMQYLLPQADKEIDIKYLYYAIVHMDLAKYFSGATIPHIYFKDYQKEPINIPEIDEQRKIARLFQEIDILIGARKKQLLGLEQIVKSRFTEMFGDPIGNPKGWTKLQLQDFVSADCSISYGIVKPGDDIPDGVPVFRPVDIVGRDPMLFKMKRTTPEISNQYKRTLLTGRELLITVRANIADTYIIDETFKGCNVGRGIVPIRTNEDVMRLEFLKGQVDYDSLHEYIKSQAKGIALIQLNMEDLRKIEFIIPPVELQDIYISFVKQSDKSKFTIRKSLKKLETLKKSLMQEYFG